MVSGYAQKSGTKRFGPSAVIERHLAAIWDLLFWRCIANSERCGENCSKTGVEKLGDRLPCISTCLAQFLCSGVNFQGAVLAFALLLLSRVLLSHSEVQFLLSPEICRSWVPEVRLSRWAEPYLWKEASGSCLPTSPIFWCTALHLGQLGSFPHVGQRCLPVTDWWTHCWAAFCNSVSEAGGWN